MVRYRLQDLVGRFGALGVFLTAIQERLVGRFWALVAVPELVPDGLSMTAFEQTWLMAHS